jgi:hypothetical protein
MDTELLARRLRAAGCAPATVTPAAGGVVATAAVREIIAPFAIH